MKKVILLLVVCIALFASCEKKSELEKAQDKMEKGLKDAGKDLEKAGKELGDLFKK